MNTSPSAKALPHPGPRTNAPFEELRQNPRSEYSLSMVFLVALAATNEQPVRGDQITYNDDDKMWTFRRKQNKTRKIFVQLSQVTSGGSIQMRVLDIATGPAWRSMYIPTDSLIRCNNNGAGKRHSKS